MRQTALALSLLLVAVPALAEDNTPSRIYVAEVNPDPSANVPPAALLVLGDSLRKAALDAVEGTRFKVISREEVNRFNDSTSARTCLQGECVTEDAEKLTADYAIETRLVNLASVYNLNIKLHGVADKQLLGQVEATASDLEKLRADAAEEVKKLVQKKILKHTGGLSGGSLEIPLLKLAQPGTLSLQTINVDADELFERSMKAHGDKTVKPETKQALWCKLASMKDNNRYLDVATESCAGWQKYVGVLNQLRDTIAKDYDVVRRVLKLSTYTKEQKLSLLDEFASTYGIFKSDRRVVFARDIRALVARDGTAELPELKIPPPGREDDVKHAQEQQAEEQREARRAAEREKAQREAEEKAAKANNPNAVTGRRVIYLALRSISPAYFLVQLGLTIGLLGCLAAAFIFFIINDFHFTGTPFVLSAAGAVGFGVVGAVHGLAVLILFSITNALGGESFSLGGFFEGLVSSPLELLKAPIYIFEFFQALVSYFAG